MSMNKLMESLPPQTELSPKLAKLARYLETNGQDAAFLGARALAQRAGVSEATVTRLAYACGYSGYTQFQAAIKEEVQQKLSLKKHVPSKGKSLFSEVVAMEREILDEMERGVANSDFTAAIEEIHKASRLVVVGTDHNTMPAEYLACFMSPLKKDVFLARELNNHSFNIIKSLPKGSVAVAYCFPRYPRASMIIVEELKKAGGLVVGISDSNFSPLAKVSDLHFAVPVKYLSYIDPYAAVMALSHALATGFLVRDAKHYHAHVRYYNEFLTGREIFLEKDLDIIGLNALDMSIGHQR